MIQSMRMRWTVVFKSADGHTRYSLWLLILTHHPQSFYSGSHYYISGCKIPFKLVQFVSQLFNFFKLKLFLFRRETKSSWNILFDLKKAYLCFCKCKLVKMPVQLCQLSQTHLKVVHLWKWNWAQSKKKNCAHRNAKMDLANRQDRPHCNDVIFAVRLCVYRCIKYKPSFIFFNLRSEQPVLKLSDTSHHLIQWLQFQRSVKQI